MFSIKMKSRSPQFILALLLTAIWTFLGIVPKAQAVGCNDLKAQWAAPAVKRLVRRGILQDGGPWTNHPDWAVTRTEMLVLLNRALMWEQGCPGSLPVLKKRVDEPQTGVSGGLNRKEKVSRQEAALTLARALDPNLDKLLYRPGMLDFKDSGAVAEGAVRGVYLAKARGIVHGDNQGYFHPREPITRAEFAVMLSQAINQYHRLTVPILTYHHLSAAKEAGSQAATVTETAFTAQMQLLADQGYHSISTRDLFAFLHNGAPLPPKPILITFDDGYESNYTLAFPVLKRLGLKAVINIVVGAAPGENGAVFDGSPLLVLRHLSWDQMREMVLSSLIEIQSHTYDSHRFVVTKGGKNGPALTSARYGPDGKRRESKREYARRVYQDLLRSKVVIGKRLGVKATALAYPFGEYNKITETAAKKAGFLMTFTSRQGMVRFGDSEYLLKRMGIRGSDNLIVFQQRLLNAWQ